MAWYDVFSHVYDSSLEPLYREHRALAAQALEISDASTILDVPCGTGQSFPHFRHHSARATIVGVDRSPGMLRRARRRAEGLGPVTLRERDAGSVTLADLDGAVPDRLHVFLGMSVFPGMGEIFTNLWSLLRPGGRAVLVDVYAERLGLQGKMVNWIARADIRRRFWEPLEAVGSAFALSDLPARRQHGGQIRIAIATKG